MLADMPRLRRTLQHLSHKRRLRNKIHYPRGRGLAKIQDGRLGAELREPTGRGTREASSGAHRSPPVQHQSIREGPKAVGGRCPGRSRSALPCYTVGRAEYGLEACGRSTSRGLEWWTGLRRRDAPPGNSQ
ncbi:hypothetical protein NDU88_006324 [Pleurodeles waltl]|uniref:Uncharacterized protein n=1 Tax=Pleurodeles waltl TaxID=8319 RepID=A0AAV7PKQ7_PLEWA|nr:hypothetical protein NDU88_006324 [Pleurodeles waltl]